ncbi:MAG TPA: fibronectin type III domain-containing protein, partial [Solirubrobacterales bacterium]
MARGGCRFTYAQGQLRSARGGLTSRVSRSGRYIAFNSIKPLTGYDNEDAASQVPGERPDAQIFVYDAATEELRCASCNPDPSVRPTAPAVIRWPATPAGNTYQRALYPQRNLADDGRVFFESYDALLPEDTGGALSVYEYDAGSGGLSLVSPGESEVESIFLDASADGSDVFFMTADRLLGADGDTAFDVYDARAGGGFPEAGEPSVPCESEAECRPPASAALGFPAPGSASFAGPGNVREAPVAGPRHKKRKHHRKHRHRRHRSGDRAGGASARAWSSDPAPGAGTSAAGEEVVEAGTAPVVVTEAADRVEEASARLRGKVYREVLFNSPQCVLLGLVCHNSAGSKITGCEFEYATEQYFESHGRAYAERAPCQPPPPYPDTEQVAIVEAALAGLEAHTTYHFRLVARNELGETGTGSDLTFMTLGTYGPPTVESEDYEIAPSEGGTFTATLRARINPHGYETSCAAQYVEDGKFRESGYAQATDLACAPPQLPVGFGGEEATAVVSGLEPGGRYHFRFLAENEVGSDTGPDRTFTTFAIESFEAGASDLQAGGHPEALVERFRLSTATEDPWGSAYPSFAVVNAKSIVTSLPPGLIGNPLATPRCAQHELIRAACSGAAQVGVLRIEGNRRQAPVTAPYELPLYNLVPPPGVAAQLGAPLPPPVNGAAHVDAGLATGTGYGIDAAALNTTAAEGLISVEATIWGVPHDPSHKAQRFCPAPGSEEAPPERGGECPSDEELESDLKPFLRNPTSCSIAPVAKLKVDAWQGPGDFVEARSEMPPMEGCDEVPFEPSFELAPTTAAADSPTGLHVDLHLPQPQSATEPGAADLRKAVIALPEGLVVNPASADGLAGCAPAQIELDGEAPARCPDASKIGTVEVGTPLLERPLRGGVYVATPHDNPFGSLLALYIAVDDPRTGIVVKLAGEVESDRETGQLTTTFDQSPQLPFEDFELDFFDGPRAALKTPATCGTFVTEGVLTPWTTPEGEEATR